jgi:predicted benzoate:H+ symporter BenE
MKKFIQIIAGLALLTALSACRETEALISTDENTPAASVVPTTSQENQKDPPKDVPKDRDNW